MAHFRPRRPRRREGDEVSGPALKTLTAESIQAAREWFAENSLECARMAKAGELYVNDMECYVEYCEKCAEDVLAGRGDMTFALWQRAYYIQTGESVALLP